MTTNPNGNNAALVVVDMQVGVLANAWDTARIANNVALAVSRARAEGVPVIWVQHSDEELQQNSTLWQLVPELEPVESEIRINKHFNSSFEQTELETVLQGLGVAHLVLAGAASNWCIRATAHAALERGYDLTLISDGHTTESIEFEDGTVIEAATIIKELNVAMNWLEYSKRKNTTVTAQALAFNA
ncbi:isochorismatase family protein [Saccharospirillum alexandrii]|uniref:isochorismatase family protein n=1 Tax=Saccharospirillum alexandrii TaxID=2448477 RepID=UPI003736C594